MPERTAVIDVGSNTMRLAVFDVGADGLIEVIEEAGIAPRLIRDINDHGRLRDETVTRALEILIDFQAIARGCGAEEITAVATSAVRDAANGDEFMARARNILDMRLSVLSGAEEARLAFLGAVMHLPVDDGLVLDIGGGSLELAEFRDRRLRRTWTFPLGAVRAAHEWPLSEQPDAAELDALRAAVSRRLAQAEIPQLGDGDVLVGTSGTIRNLSKVSAVATDYPLPRLHGHTLSVDDLAGVRDLLAASPPGERAQVPGLNADRADTILPGAVTVEAVMSAVRAGSMLVSGQGLREGVATSHSVDRLPPCQAIRDAALVQMQQRFAPGWTRTAAVRRSLVETLGRSLMPEAADDVRAGLAVAAELFDIGRGIDYYRRGRHAEAIVLAHGVPGFTHREMAMAAVLMRYADQDRVKPNVYAPLLGSADHRVIAEAGAVLAVAEELARRTAVGEGSWSAVRLGDEITLTGPFAGQLPAAAAQQVSAAFGVCVQVEPIQHSDE